MGIMNKTETYLNLGKSLHAFNEIELFINIIITHHIKPKDKLFFLNYILNPTVISFGAKLKILINLDIFSKNQIKDIRYLSINRNVIAHSNRQFIPRFGKTIDNTLQIAIHDLIFKTNSDGKLIEMKYSEFIKEHIELQDRIIDFISEYIISKDISTKPYHISNLKSLKDIIHE